MSQSCLKPFATEQSGLPDIHSSSPENLTRTIGLQGPHHISPTVHAEDEETEEDGDAHQRDCCWGREELPVVDAEIPDDCQHDHEDGYHQAACAEGQAHASGPLADTWPHRLHRAGPPL